MTFQPLITPTVFTVYQALGRINVYIVRRLAEFIILYGKGLVKCPYGQ